MSNRAIHLYSIDHISIFRKKLLAYLNSEEYVFYLNSNQSLEKHSSYDLLVGVGIKDSISTDHGKAFEQLQNFQLNHFDWMFGWLGYDLKNEVEQLQSLNSDRLAFPDMCFVVPEHVFEIGGNELKVHSFASSENIDHIISEIENSTVEDKEKDEFHSTHITAGYNRKEYLKTAKFFLDHIKRGDIYEANFCTQFSASQVGFDDLKAYQDLNKISEPPFSAWVRCGEYQVVSASMERYLKKEGNKLISQPIKGTAKRVHDSELDERSKKELFLDPKERSENVMIVDLVRNDLARTAVKGSVKVDELYGIYSFKQVHHMISSISSQLREDCSGIDAIKSTFPMGSMTGAPKVSAMKIIENNENFKRGLYSGAIGYFTPTGDFDFNVVIRSILYNKHKKELSFAVGSALTIAANPEKEYEECLLKAKALFETLEKQGIKAPHVHA